MLIMRESYLKPTKLTPFGTFIILLTRSGIKFVSLVNGTFFLIVRIRCFSSLSFLIHRNAKPLR